jgi:hypothetical protein
MRESRDLHDQKDELSRIIAEATTRARAKQMRLRLMKERNELYLASRRDERGDEDDFDDEFTKELEARVSSV